MIEVNVTYTKKTRKVSGNEIFYYKDIVVKGHSSDGTINSIKCCAGVTAITCGLLNLLDGETNYCSVEVNKGYFHYHMNSNYSAEINFAINALVYQLDSISMIYPQFFKFNYIEEKDNGKD